MTIVTTYAQQSWNIVSSRVVTYCEQVYNISYVSSISSSFEILGNFEVYHESEYVILPYDDIEAEYDSLYAFVSSGILGLTERILGIWNAWSLSYDERSIHLHLYNTYISNTYTTYERYYQIYSSKNIFVERPLLYDERTIQLLYYTEYSSQKYVFTASLDEYFSIHYAQTSAYEINISDRTIVCSQMLSQESERATYILEAYTSARTIIYKKWYETERWIGTYAKEKSIYADQRTSFVQIVLNKFESIRMIGFEVCSLSFPIIINPTYVNYAITIHTSEIILFENEEVVNTVELISTLPITVFDTSRGLIINNDNSEYNSLIYTDSESIAYIIFDNIVNTSSYIYTGDIITTKEVAFIKIKLQTSSIDTFDTEDEYLSYIQSVGYLKIEIAGKEMFNNSSSVIDVPAFTKIPIVIQAHSSIIRSSNINIVLKWAYPYSDMVINEILLIGSI